jgi:hypothetical protein
VKVEAFGHEGALDVRIQIRCETFKVGPSSELESERFALNELDDEVETRLKKTSRPAIEIVAKSQTVESKADPRAFQERFEASDAEEVARSQIESRLFAALKGEKGVSRDQEGPGLPLTRDELDLDRKAGARALSVSCFDSELNPRWTELDHRAAREARAWDQEGSSQGEEGKESCSEVLRAIHEGAL